MIKLMSLEWRKLRQKSVISEIIIYPFILMFLPVFFITVVDENIGQNYASVIELNLAIQMGFILFGGSLINQVFIDEYKNNTISLSFSYPVSRQKLFTAKILFIATFVFLLTAASYLLTGIVTYVIDQVQPLIQGEPTRSDYITFFSHMIFRPFIVTIMSFIPLFYFGIWKRATVLTIICSIILMQSHLAPLINLNVDLVLTVLCVLGGISIFLSIMTAEKIGER